MTEAREQRGPTSSDTFLADLLEKAPQMAEGSVAMDEVSKRIVAAARAQIETVGWRRSTVEDIARRAQLGRATVYRKFPSKHDLLDAVMRAEVCDYYANRAAIAQQATVEDRIVQSVKFTIEHIRNNSVLKRLVETEPEFVLPALTIDASPLLQLVSALAIPVWQNELHHGEPISGERLQHFRTVAELHARITLSFILTRDSAIPLETPEQAEKFARKYLAPMLLEL